MSGQELNVMIEKMMSRAVYAQNSADASLEFILQGILATQIAQVAVMQEMTMALRQISLGE